MGLFMPWLSKNEEKAIKAVGKVKSEELLKKIAEENAAAWNVKRAAISRITDQKWLAAKVARCGSEPYSLALIAQLTDQDELKKLALTDNRTPPNCLPRAFEAVFERLTQATLEAVASGANDSGARSLAVEKLTDSAALARVALVGKRTDNRELAPVLSRITDADAADAAIAALLASEPFSVRMTDGAMELLNAFSGRLPRSEKLLREKIGAVHADTPGSHVDRVGGHTDSSGSHQDASQATVLGSADCHHDYPGRHEDKNYAHTDSHPYGSKLSKLPPYEGK